MAVPQNIGILRFLMERGLVDRFREKTGLVIDAYFSATKLKWILDEVPGVRERAERGDLYFGTVETWLIWKMTKGKVHVTDYTNASRTMLFNIHTLKWDEDILKELNIPLCMLPEVRPSSCVYGETASTYFGRPDSDCGRQRETSRRRCSARPAMRRAKRKIHTEQAASC